MTNAVFLSFNESVDKYLRQIAKYPLLSAKEEYEVAKRVKDGDANAKRQLIQSNLRLVVSVIKKNVVNSNLTFFDLIQEGNTGLMIAVDKFNYKLGYLTRMQMPNEDFANKIFANNTTKGTNLLQPIYANGYYYIVLVNDIRIPEKYTDVNREVIRREYLNANMTTLLEAEKTKQAEVLKAAVSGINNLARLNGNGLIKYYKPDKPFSYNQGRLNTAEGTIIPDSSTEAFYMHVFSMQTNQISDVIKLDNGVAVIRLVSEEKPNMATLTTFDAATKNAVKRELSMQRMNLIQIEWENQHIAYARVKKHNLR